MRITSLNSQIVGNFPIYFRRSIRNVSPWWKISDIIKASRFVYGWNLSTYFHLIRSYTGKSHLNITNVVNTVEAVQQLSKNR